MGWKVFDGMKWMVKTIIVKAILVTHFYSDKLVLRRIQYFITNIWCIGCAEIFNVTISFIAWIPIPTHDEMSEGSVEKCTKHLQDLM